MASLRDLVRTILPLARPVGTTPLDPARGEREVTWVRVLKARVPAFEALESGDLAIIPGRAGRRRPESGPDRRPGRRARPRRVPAVLLVDGTAARRQSRRRIGGERRADRPARRQDGSDRPRAERDRLPRQSPRGARPAGGRPRGPAGTAGTAGPGSRRAGRGDRRVPRASRGDRGPAGRPDRGPRPGELEGPASRSAATCRAPAPRRSVAIPAPADEPGAGGRLVPARRRPAERAGTDRGRPDRGAPRARAGPRRRRPPGARGDPAR